MPKNDETQDWGRKDLDGRGPRYDLSNTKVMKMLQRGFSICEAARRLGCSETLVVRVRDGIRRDLKLPDRHKLNGRRLCSCCRARPVKKGNRFLCESCFKSGSNGELYYDATCYVSF